MTDKDFTWLAIVQDRSGSIADCLTDQQGGLNTFIAEQRKVPGRCAVTYTQFDTRCEIVFEGRPIEQVGFLSIEPRGGTALLDAIGRTILHTGERLRALPEEQRPGAVIFVVNTDGEENSSREFTNERIAEMVREQTERWQWLFVFLSAGPDAFSQARAMGFSHGTTVAYDVRNSGSTYAMTSSNVGSYRIARAAGAGGQSLAETANFTEEQREQATTKGS